MGAALAWRGVRAGIAALVALAWLAGSGLAAELPEVGSILQDRLQLAGRAVPLPPGEWIVLGRGFGRVEGPSPGPYGALLGVMLAHRQDSRIDAVVLAATNALPVEQGWGPAPECGAAEMAFASEIKQQARNLSCAFVPPSGLAPAALGGLPAWQSGAAEAERRGWPLPESLLVAGMRASDRHDVIEVRYGFAPGSLRGDPLAALAPWTEAAERRLAAGMLALPGPAGPLPWPAPRPDAATVPAEELSVWRISLYKMLTNRVVQSSITYGLGLLITGDLYASAVMTFWQGVTHSLVYLGNELFWEWPSPPPALAFVAAEGRP
jgi:hypothetical protein